MFSALLNRLKEKASGTIEKYVLRASVVIPFALALGYLLAGATSTLSNWYGATISYYVMAGVLASLGLLAVLVIAVKERHDEEAPADTPGVVGQTAAELLVRASAAIAQSSNERALAKSGATGLLAIVAFVMVSLLVAGGRTDRSRDYRA